MNSLFRYPGGKKKLYSNISQEILRLSEGKSFIYCEPFLGGGAVTTNLLLDKRFKIIDYYVNDSNFHLINLWKCIFHNYPENLVDNFKELILNYIPQVQDFYTFKNNILSTDKNIDIIHSAFQKLVLHQISYSGLAEMSGGPIGGRKQTSKYNINCRWNPHKILKKFLEFYNSIESKKDSIHIFNLDYIAYFQMIESICKLNNIDDVIIYLDPPYITEGQNLYINHFKLLDHQNLGELIKNIPFKWILSYDDHPSVYEMYNNFNIQKINTNYSINGRIVKQELLITNA